MLNRMLQTDPTLRDPVQNLNADRIREHIDLETYQEKTPKSRIRQKVRSEYETAEALCRQLDAMAAKADTWTPAFQDLERSLTGGNYYNAQMLYAHPLWQQYAAFVQQRPLKCKALFSKLCADARRAKETLYAQFASTEKGESGEDRVAEYLELFRGKYIVRSNVLINSRTGAHAQTAETDFCIITEKGIAVCEVKNYGNESQTLRISRDGRWELVRGNSLHGRVLNPSPAAQNTIHCRELECFLEEKGFRDIPLIPIVIVPNNKVAIDNQGSNHVIRMEELYNVLQREPLPARLDGQTMQRIAAVLDAEDVEERWFDVTVLGDKASRSLGLAEEILRQYTREAAWFRRLSDRVVDIVSREVGKQSEQVQNEGILRKIMYAVFAVMAVGVMLWGGSLGELYPVLLMTVSVPLIWTCICTLIVFSRKAMQIKCYVPVLIGAAVVGLIFGLLCAGMGKQDMQFLTSRFVMLDLLIVAIGALPVVEAIKQRLGY